MGFASTSSTSIFLPSKSCVRVPGGRKFPFSPPPPHPKDCINSRGMRERERELAPGRASPPLSLSQQCNDRIAANVGGAEHREKEGDPLLYTLDRVNHTAQ